MNSVRRGDRYPLSPSEAGLRYLDGVWFDSPIH